VANKLTSLEKDNAIDPGAYWGHPCPAMMVLFGGKLGYMQTPCAKGNILGPPFCSDGGKSSHQELGTGGSSHLLFECPFTTHKQSKSKTRKERQDLAKALGLSQDDALVALERGAFPIQESPARRSNT
jgi:hypothetical protein